MTSSSGNGSTRISLQFDLNRKIDSAAREVQAAINASRADLPSTLRSNPTYRKANPSAAPVIILALTSPTRSPGQIYDAVSNVVQQKVAQVLTAEQRAQLRERLSQAPPQRRGRAGTRL